MPSPPVASAAAFLDLVERSGLLLPDRVDPYRDADPPPPPPALAAALVRDRLLTKYQADHLLRGRARGYFLAGKYKVLEPVGAGGMGQVFLCEHLILHKLVAVKLLGSGAKAAPPAGAVERFYREARAVAALDDRNIVRVYDVDATDGVPFMVMEYVDGIDLHRLVAASGPLAVPQACEYTRQAALGLQHAHEIGLVHRDVKPGNVLVDRAGVVKLLDLGLARFQLDTTRNQSVTERFDGQAVLGTADFIAPEQALDSSKADIRSDVYGLGCTLYYLLTGKLVWGDGSFAQKLLWHQSRTPPSVRETWPDIPEPVDAVVARMLAKDPADRFQEPGEVAEVLELWSVPRPGPPPANLLPKLTPGMYLLGLSPVPPPASSKSGTVARVGPRTPAPVSPPVPLTPAPRVPAPPPSTPSASNLDTARVRKPVPPSPDMPSATAPEPAVVVPNPPAAPSHRHSLRRDIGLLLAGAVVAAALAGLYVTIRDAGTKGPPGEPPPAVAK